MSEQTGTTDGLEQLLSLEEKIQQTIEMLKAARAEKEDLRRENAEMRQNLEEQGAEKEDLERENVQLRQSLEEQTNAARMLEERAGRLEKEREAVRARVQRLVEQVDAATAARTEA